MELQRPESAQHTPTPPVACKRIYCRESGGLMTALEEAFAADGPAILVVPIDYTENIKLTERLGQIACSI